MSGIFGRSGGGGQQQMLMLQALQQQQQMQNLQGQQLKTISGQQAASDMEAAGLARPGLGRAMLTYGRKDNTGGAQTFGG